MTPDVALVGGPVAVSSWWPGVAVALPLVGVAAVSAGCLTDRWRVVALVVPAVAALAVALVLVGDVLAGRLPELFVLHMTPTLWMVLRVDAPGALYGATVAALGLLALVYSFGYVRRGPRWSRYFGFLMASLACTLGVAYAGNLLTFLIFYEAFSVLTYALVVHEQTPEAIRAGAKYIAYILVGGSLVLAGILLTYFLAGDLTFAAGGFLAADASRGQLLTAFWCFVAGFGVKAALVPLHGWVPDAHPAAPAPFSAVLSGVMVAAGAFGIMRVALDVYGAPLVRALGVAPWLTAIAAVTVLVGALLALGQEDLKRRLAYSTISQMGYLTLAVSLLGPGVMAGALVHLVHHAFLKGTLFFCAGLWIHASGVRRVAELRGMGARMPLTAAAFTLAVLGVIGVPPLSGFVSKWWLGVGMLQVDAAIGLAVLLAGALLAAAYLLPVVYAVYFAPTGAIAAHAGSEAPAAMLAPTLVAAAMTIVFGLGSHYAGFPLQLAQVAVAAWFGGG
ncbi:MAG: complex I subunit 5 family protein [Trueperaceae bacterium]